MRFHFWLILINIVLKMYLSEVHDGGSEVVGPPVVALGAGVPRSPVPTQVHHYSR